MSDNITPRKPWIASTFSQLAPGLGHIYCGDVRTGLAIYLAGFLLMPLVITLLLLGSSAFVAWGLLGLVMVGGGIAVASSWHSKKLANAMSDYQLTPINRWWMYTLLAIQPVFYAVPIALIVKAHVVEAFYISTDDMAPNLLAGDRLLVDKRGAGRRTPARGEVIIFRKPTERSKHNVRRVIGLPGETLVVGNDGRVSINGIALEAVGFRRGELPLGAAAPQQPGCAYYTETSADADYVVLLPAPNADQLEPFTMVVPPEHVVVLGDNREGSVDSRDFGPVPFGDILGPANFIYTPVNSWSRFGRVQ